MNIYIILILAIVISVICIMQKKRKIQEGMENDIKCDVFTREKICKKMLYWLGC